MTYKIFDLLQSFIDIENMSLKLYLKIEEHFKNESQEISILAKTIAKQEQKHIEYYESLSSSLKGKLDDSIDFYLYDKISGLLFEFKKNIKIPEVNTSRYLIEFAIEFERNNVALLLNIQGRLLQNINDVNNRIYRVISIIIREEEEHENMFRKLLK
ncbi:ferritin family protein [Clostridium kluyveri]|uniref:Rubrerythrin family protein n=1 Tax=Clostridium kluyveri TaxID=1534 RepID=A0A1L5F4E0_CLOKL|nr:ferritin family protein [Clostridium kluyveri]APM37879.1 rubrerythrin family protein [Clostridium kluyveri]UZQ52118.1 rubrerythrin family protein [Clostridium kluyveri]